MKKIIIPIVLFAILISVWLYVFNDIKSELDQSRKKYKEMIGQKFVLEKDTLTIIDYSGIKETFTLSNGQEINENLVFNQQK